MKKSTKSQYIQQRIFFHCLLKVVYKQDILCSNYSMDLVNAFWHFYQKPRCGEVYNIGGSRRSKLLYARSDSARGGCFGQTDAVFRFASSANGRNSFRTCSKLSTHHAEVRLLTSCLVCLNTHASSDEFT